MSTIKKGGNSFLRALLSTRWFKYDRDYLCVNKSQFIPVIFEQPFTYDTHKYNLMGKPCVVTGCNTEHCKEWKVDQNTGRNKRELKRKPN
jgi:hypothetical protein